MTGVVRINFYTDGLQNLSGVTKYGGSNPPLATVRLRSLNWENI